MERDRLLPIALALLAVIALAAAAATVDSAISGGAGAGEGDQDRTGIGSGQRLDFGNFRFQDLPDPPAWLVTLGQLLFVLVLLVSLVSLGYALYTDPKGTLATLVVGVVVTTVLMLALFWLLSNLGGAGGGNSGIIGGQELSLPGGGDGSQGADAGSATPIISTPLTSFLAVVVVVLLLAGAALLRGTGDAPLLDDPDPIPDPPAPEPQSLVDVGSAAGRAADDIEAEDVTVENAVYRAWREMTGYIDVENPATSTPGEFAAAAEDAGMAPDDVRELTALFEATRYGGAQVTEVRAERAVEALRRIERRYGDDA